MIYAYDLNIQMPTKDLYDTQIMAMSLNAAKDMYEKGLKQLDDFYEKYGDFYSPIGNDMDWYNRNVTGRISLELNDLYTSGIDPLRSAEGRSRIAKLVRNIDVATINAMKRNAIAAEKYYQGVLDLKQKGLYNQAMEDWLNGDLSLFSTVGQNGLNAFNYTPTIYKDIDTMLEPIIKNIKPSYDEAKTKADKQHRIWTTISKDRLMQAFDDNLSDILSTPSGKFLLHQSEEEASLYNAAHPGSNVTGLDILKKKAENRLSDHVQESFTYDPLYQKEYESALAYNRWKREYDYQIKNPKTSGDRSGGSGGKIPDSVMDRNNAALLGKISGTSGAIMGTPEGAVLAAARIKPYQTRFGQQFESDYGVILRSPTSLYTPWSMGNNPKAKEAFSAYKSALAVPLGKEQFYEQFGETARDNAYGQSSLREIPIGNVIDNLISPEDFITNTTGMIDGKETHTTSQMREQLRKSGGYIIPQDWDQKPMLKDGRLHEGWWVDVYDSVGNKIGEAIYDMNNQSEYIRKTDGAIITNAGLTSTGNDYIANIAISSDSAPGVTHRARNLDKALGLTNTFDNSESYFMGQSVLPIQE